MTIYNDPDTVLSGVEKILGGAEDPLTRRTTSSMPNDEGNDKSWSDPARRWS